MPATALEALTDRMRPQEFVDCYVLDITPALFGGDRLAYLEWRRNLAHAMEVDPVAIQIVGSAGVGFSLDPANRLRVLTPTSDVDVAVVSAWHFDLAWRDLQQKVRSSFKFPPSIGASIRKYAPRDVFAGCIATDKVLPVLPFAKRWLEARETATEHRLLQDRRIDFRLYRDFAALRAYQLFSVHAVHAHLEGE